MTFRSLAVPTLAVVLVLAGCSGSTGATDPHQSTNVSLAVGQSSVFLDSPHLLANLQVDSGARYLIAVVNTDGSNSSLEDFDLHGSFTAASAASMALARLRTAQPTAAAKAARSAVPAGAMRGGAIFSGPEMQRLMQVTARAERAHLRLLAINRALATRYGSPLPKLAARQATAAAQSTVPSTTIGTVNHLFVRNFGAACSSGDSIGARTVAVSPHAIVVADTTSTWTQRPDTGFYQTLADEYSTLTYPMVSSYIGNPLLMDSKLSNVGRVTIVITPRLNADSGIAAFVNPCDWENETGSNFTETIYNWVADSLNGYPLSLWEKFLRPTLAHETKHVASFAQRYSDGGVFETVWLEEGTAQMSSEIWMRNFDQTAWKSSANFDQTLGCEFVTTNTCYGATKPAGLFNHLEFLYDYLSAATGGGSSDPEGLASTIEGEYGAGWSFARWTADQYASSEQTFLHGIIDDETNISVQNLMARSGQSAATLQVYWVLATALDSIQFTPSDPRLTVPSFNFANIYAAADSVFSLTFPRLEPVWPHQVASGTFDQTVDGIQGLSGASYIMLNATTTGTESLELRSGTGGSISASSGLRVGIVRVQ